ncbi:NADH-quinone oxidoreductase subunit M [Ilyomonas limi]|uniref:NADH-quinone oxidoreductase subunit M n=1 Tax=Ilyomonas limi TaxID=2575867 RepID=A0A4U3LAI2_9BACT|nr:NADH-quinone oxidoreductase subunit M [Ilyomonas limi]TKK70787.1 NADH-quinone oxidoreductase subunit M [Ilyomonas limi]
MIALFLILIPLFAGLVAVFVNSGKGAKGWSLIASFATLALAILSVYSTNHNQLFFNGAWLPQMGSNFSLSLDGMSKMLALLNAIALPIIIISTYRNDYKNPGRFYSLMLLMQAGMMGVFLASDSLLFYFFWELALVPAYFLCSMWGGERRIPVTFKFFVYTFLGSLLMLIGILYLYFKTPGAHSFALQAFYDLKLTQAEQNFGFWMFFIAFAIKMPIFPFHTWQPDTYEQSTTAVTMMLSAIMVKMGIYAVIRWCVPVFPLAVAKFDGLVVVLSVIGIIYASLIAIRQDDMKRLIAYSSIAHIGLMSAAIFAGKEAGLQGVMIQMFNHGIVVLGLWIVADAIEQQFGTRKFSQLGGLAQKAPDLAILFVVMAFANISLPLTNSFVGEFLMLNGLFQYNWIAAAVAIVSIILAAAYTLSMVQKIFYGQTSELTMQARDSAASVNVALAVLVVLILFFGVYPQPMIELTSDTVKTLLAQVKTF